MGGLAVSDDGRYLTVSDGAPFFWLADTAWELLHRLDLDETAHYLDVRREQGFNVIQTVALAEIDGIRTPNRAGALPLQDQDPATPDLEGGYWDHVDRVVDMAAERAMHIAMLPTWGDKVVSGMWGEGPAIFTPENALAFGRFLGARYQDRTNLVWVLGGDRPFPPEAKQIWREMARGLHEKAPFLTTAHPMGGRSTSEEIHEEPWLDLNMLQTGHGRDLPRVSRMIERSLAREPRKPVLDGEPIYELHPVGFDHLNGVADAADVRSHTAQSVFAGGCGVTYGCHTIWQMAQDRFSGLNNPIGHWRDALRRPGADAMRHLRAFAEREELVMWAPATDVLLDTYPFPARVSPEGLRAAVYVQNAPEGVILGRAWRGAEAEWFDVSRGLTVEGWAEGDKLGSSRRNSRLEDLVLILTRPAA